MEEVYKLKILILFLSFYLPLAQAAYIGLEAPNEKLRLLGTYQFKTLLYQDDGSIKDVSSKAQYYSLDATEIRQSELMIELPSHRNIVRFYISIEVEYNYQGNRLRDQRRFLVDGAPSYIFLEGPYNVSSGARVHYKAFGYYDDGRLDLSHYGRWESQLRGVFYNGFYQAPLTGNGWSKFDQVRFYLGNSFQSIPVTVGPY